MKKTALLAVLVLALAGTRLQSEPVEGAGIGPRLESSADGAENDARTRVPFTASYFAPLGGNWTCVGVRITGDGSRPLTKDTEQCTITDLVSFPPGTYRGGAKGFYVNGVLYTWTSDYDGLPAIGINLIVTDNGDGTGHVDADTYY